MGSPLRNFSPQTNFGRPALRGPGRVIPFPNPRPGSGRFGPPVKLPGRTSFGLRGPAAEVAERLGLGELLGALGSYAGALLTAYELGKLLGDNLRGQWSAATASQFGYAVDFSCGVPWTYVSVQSNIPSVLSCGLMYAASRGDWPAGLVPGTISFWGDGALQGIPPPLNQIPSERWSLVTVQPENAGARSLSPVDYGPRALQIGSIVFAPPLSWNPVVVAAPLGISPYIDPESQTDQRGYDVAPSALPRTPRYVGGGGFLPWGYITDTQTISVTQIAGKTVVRVNNQHAPGRRNPLPGRVPSQKPKKPEKEKKANGKAAKAIQSMGYMLQGVATGNGMINALWNTLPWRLQGSHYQSMFQKAERIGEHLGDVDWKRASDNLARYIMSRAAAGRASGIVTNALVSSLGPIDGYNAMRALTTASAADEHNRRVQIFHKHLEQQRLRKARAAAAQARREALFTARKIRRRGASGRRRRSVVKHHKTK